MVLLSESANVVTENADEVPAKHRTCHAVREKVLAFEHAIGCGRTSRNQADRCSRGDR